MKIINIGHKILNKIEAKIKNLNISDKFGIYKNQMDNSHPFKEFPMEIIGDMSANPHEFFSHYDSYSFWLANKLKQMGG
jgi:hypothetical protein